MRTITYKYPSGRVFTFENIPSEFSYKTRMEFIQEHGGKAATLYFEKRDMEKSNAHSSLLWDLFEDYLNAYNFNYVSRYCSNRKPKVNYSHLYILKNSNGFIKVGKTKNVKTRIIDLGFEFDGKWEIIKILYGRGYMESIFHEKLMSYIIPIRKKHTNKFSSECFENNKEVLKICQNLSNGTN